MRFMMQVRGQLYESLKESSVCEGYEDLWYSELVWTHCILRLPGINARTIRGSASSPVTILTLLCWLKYKHPMRIISI